MTYKDIIERLNNELNEINNINEYKKLLKAISFNNDINISSLLYILSQKRDFTYLGTKNMWNKINRNIIKDSKPIYIF